MTAMPTTHELTKGFFNTDTSTLPKRNCSLGNKAMMEMTFTKGMHTAKITASICDPLPAANAETIAKMKNSVRILNFARGDLVNTGDIINALADGKVAAYATDFLKDELIDATGVITIPHLGASTPESEDNCAVMAVDELKDYIENGNITNSVNMPAVSVPRSGKTRITIIHKNVPNVISRITAIVAEENINIDNMVNKSRGEYAYTMLDTDTEVSNDAITAISSQDFAIRVRVIK